MSLLLLRKEARAAVVESLRAGTFGHWPRKDVFLKNRLAAGRISVRDEDVLGLLAARAGAGTAPVLKSLLHEFGNDPAFAQRGKRHAGGDLAMGPAGRNVSVRVPSHILAAVDQMARMVGLSSRKGGR